MEAPFPERAAESIAHLLVVDDDAGIRLLLAERLGTYGYRVTTASGVAEMDRVLARGGVDLVILDVMMPGEDGLTACRRVLSQDESYELIEHLKKALKEIEALPPVSEATAGAAAPQPAELTIEQPSKSAGKAKAAAAAKPEAPREA